MELKLIQVELFYGTTVICQGISSDPMNGAQLLCQMEDGDLKELHCSNIKHISAVK